MKNFTERLSPYVEQFMTSPITFFLSFFKPLPRKLRYHVRMFRSYYRLERQYRKILDTTPPPPAQPPSENKFQDAVWWLWFQGVESTPPICKACLASVRRYLPDKKIVVLSEQNLWDYVEFPDYIMEKYRRGMISRTHFSDIVRTQLLVKYGGLWIDSTIYLTGRPDFALGLPFFVFSGESLQDNPSRCFDASFISAERGSPIFSLTQDLLFDYWKKHDRLWHYFLFFFFLAMSAKKYINIWDEMPVCPNVQTHIMQREMFKPFSEKKFAQIKAVSPVHKMTYKYDKDRDIRGTILEHVIQSVNSPV